MVFKASRQVLLLPTALGGLNVLFGAAILAQRAASGTFRLDFDTVGAVILVVMGMFFLQVAWKLSRYQLELTDTGLLVGPKAAGDPDRQLAWAEIDQLVKQETPGKGRRPPSIVYRVGAGKRQMAFTSLLFKDHELLATRIAEHTGKNWETQSAKP